MYAAIQMVDLEVEVVRRGDAGLVGRPLAVVDPGRGGLVAGCSREAALAGVVAGDGLARALARCPDLLARERDRDAEAVAQLVDYGRSLSADVEASAAATIIVDVFAVAACRHDPHAWRARVAGCPDSPGVAGVQGSRGGKKSAALGRCGSAPGGGREGSAAPGGGRCGSAVPAGGRCGSAAPGGGRLGPNGGPFGFPLRVALGPTPDLAHLSVAAGAPEWQAQDAMGWPLGLLGALGAPTDLLERWQAWGLQSLGDLAALGGGGVTARQGALAGRWQQVVAGREHRPLRLCREPVAFAEALELDERIETLEPLLFILNRVLGTLETRLASAQRVAVAMALELAFENGERHRKSLRVAEPTRERAVLLGILRTYLETVAAASPVVAVALELEPSLPGEAQTDLFRRGLPELNRFFETLGRIEGLVGPGNVGVPVPADTHEPDRFALLPYGTRVPPQPPQAKTLPLRRFRPPIGVRVACVEAAPVALLSGRYAGRIDKTRGPFFLSGKWWEPGGCWRRVEWDVEMASRQLLRLARLPGNQWQLEGVYG